jgi:DNA-binding transcriptional LysR family regulator
VCGQGLHKLASYPLVLCDPQVYEGYYRELARLLRPLEREPDIAEHVSSLDMMLTLVGAGYGVGFIRATRVAASQRSDVVIRPLAMDSAVITTYLLRPASEDLPGAAARFIARLRAHSGD